MKSKAKLTLPFLFVLAASSANGAFVISQPNTNAEFGSAATGQTFTPSVGMVDDPGPATTIDLIGFSLWTGGTGINGTSPTRTRETTYLLIYDKKPTESGSILVGASSNSLNLVTVPSVGSELAWTFDSLTLNYTTQYWAVIASSNTGTDINDIGIELEVQSTNPYPGGTGLIADFGAAGADAKFLATFANPVPEPSTLTVFAAGLVLLGTYRRRV